MIGFVVGSLVLGGSLTGPPRPGTGWGIEVLSPSLLSGAEPVLNAGTVLLIAAMTFCFVAIARAAHARPAGLQPSIIAVIAFGVHVIAFLTLPAAGSSLFLLLTVIALLEALSITVIGAARATPGSA
ncbi:MAG: hypothetical protein AAF580_14570 [Pseudomonadota bacterium]